MYLHPISTILNPRPAGRSKTLYQLASALALCLLLCVTARATGQPPNLAWVDRYDGTGNNSDFAADILPAPNGDLYVAGTTFEQGGPGSLIPRVMAIRYRPDGSRVWLRVVPTDVAAAEAAAVDSAGNLFVAATINPFDELMLAKYSPAGDLLWVESYPGDPFMSRQSYDVTVDPAGNAYLIGYEYFSGDTQITVIRYLPDGTSDWVRTYAGTLGAQGVAAVADATAVYITGSVGVDSASGDMLVLQLFADGTFGWNNTYSRPGQFVVDMGSDIAFDSAGNLVAVGWFGSNTVEGPDLAAVKIAADGSTLWERTFDGALGEDDLGISVAVDSQDRVVVGGRTEVGLNDHDALVVKYDTDGTFLWARSIDGGAMPSADRFNDVAVGPMDSIYATGRIVPEGSGNSYLTARYSASGQLAWQHEYPGPINGGSVAVGVAVDAQGTAYVTGGSFGNGSNQDLTTLALNDALFTDGFESGNLAGWSAVIP